MRRFFQGDAQEEENEINITPMLDVVFIMLIFFIVTASFVREHGLDVTRPDSQPQQQQERSNILIVVNENNEFWMDQRQVDSRALRANIERRRAEMPDASVVVQPHPRARTRALVTAMDSARQAGVMNVSIASVD
jgi:biopolymer transport protein ExbD